MKTQKVIIFDAGALISFSMNGITNIIKDLRGVFQGKFMITQEVKKEIVDKPIKIKRFKLEALKMQKLIDEGILEFPSSLGIDDSEINKQTNELLDIANETFKGNGKGIHIIDIGEASCIALGRMLNKMNVQNVIAVDERTLRSLIETPEDLKKFLGKKLHTKITSDKNKLKFFKGFKIIRSPELIYVAYKKGLIKFKDKTALDSLLYAVKYKGASISNHEIEEMEKIAGVE